MVLPSKEQGIIFACSLLPAGYSHIVWVGCATGFVKVLPFTRVNFANFVTLYQSTLSVVCYYSFCLLSDPIKQDPILEQFSMITRP